MPMLVAITFAYLLSQFYRSFLAILAPELSQDLGLTAADLGSISAAFFAAFALAQLPIGWAIDRFGGRLTIAVMMTLSVVGAGLFTVAGSAAACIVAMALIGIGCAPVYIGGVLLIARTMPADRFATLSSTLVGVGTLGNLLAATPLAAAMQAFGWRASMLGIAGLTALAALVVAALVRDPPDPDRGETRVGGVLGGLGDVLRIRALWLIFPLTLTSYAVVVAVRGLWVGPYFSEVHGLDPVARGHAVTAMVVAMIAAAFVYAPMDRWLGTRKWIVAGGTLLTILALAGIALMPRSGVVVSAALFAAVGGFGMTYGVLMAHGRAFLPDHLASRGVTLLNFLFIGGAGVIQPLSGLLVETLRAGGTRDAGAIYGTLHGVYALVLAVALAFYLAARDAPLPRRAR